MAIPLLPIPQTQMDVSNPLIYPASAAHLHGVFLRVDTASGLV